MSEKGDQSGTDSFSDDVLTDNAEISTTVFVAVIVLIAFSLDIISFEWAVVAMLGLIAASSVAE
jgi:hypothetical protein